MKAEDIKPHDIFIVSPGRSVLTAKRGMAHAGGKITLADVGAESMADYLESGKVTIDEEAVEARAMQDALDKEAEDEAIKAGTERAADAANAADLDAPPTEAEIIEAIGKLDADNPEHWKADDAPQVTALEGVLGKQITAADRDSAWSKVNQASS